MKARIVKKSNGIKAELFPAPQNIFETLKMFLKKQYIFLLIR